MYETLHFYVVTRDISIYLYLNAFCTRGFFLNLGYFCFADEREKNYVSLLSVKIIDL